MIVKETRAIGITDKQTNKMIWITASQIPTVKADGVSEILLIKIFYIFFKMS